MNDPVAGQYERWVYPRPMTDVAEQIRSGAYREIGDPAEWWPLFWPRRRGPEVRDILVAGCGTNQAAYYALRHPDSRVVGVDVSASSLSHAASLKAEYALDNLTLVQLDLADVAQLGTDFDFIVATGVLHHLSDPVAGLASLGSVLRPEGVVNVMVYGTSLRLGVYLMQDLFRTMGLEQDAAGVAMVRSILRSLPPDHAVQKYLRAAPDLDDDAGIVDTFLNPRDRSYLVPGVYELVHAAGLEFLTWCDPLEYSLTSHVSPGHPAWKALSLLDERDAAHACDLLTQDQGTHRFAAAHPEYVAALKVAIDGASLRDCVVLLHPDAQVLDHIDVSNSSLVCERRGMRFNLSQELHALMEAMSTGSQTLGDAVSEVGDAGGDRAEVVSHLQREVMTLRSQGHVFVLLPGSARRGG